MQYRRTLLLINPRFQLKYTLYIVSWVLPMLLVFPFVAYEIFEFVLRFATTVGMPEEVVISFSNTRHDIIWLLVVAEICFVLGTFLISLRVSHKIAGPIYKLRMQFEKAKKGDFESSLSFRKADYFKEVATDYNEMIDGIRNILDKNVGAVTDSIQRLEDLKKEVEKDKNPKMLESIDQTVGELKAVREQIFM